MNELFHIKGIRVAALCAGMTGSFFAGSAQAQVADIFKIFSGPKIDVTIEHPPALPLKITTIAIGEATGRCADSLSTRLEEAFVAAGAAVIDRQHLREVLSEHKLQVSGMVDEKTASRIGKLLGAQALLFLQTQDCGASQNRQPMYTDKKTKESVYNYVTAGRVAGSVRIVDLSTGRVLAAQPFEGTASLSDLQNYISQDVAVAESEKSAVTKLSQLLLPWKETKSMVFYSDSTCDLRTANRLLKAKDLDGALVQSEQNLEKCKSPGFKPAALARAHYNLGIMQFIKSDYDAALANLTQADKLSSSRVFLDAITDCRQAKESSIALLEYHGESPKNAVPPSNQTFAAKTKPGKSPQGTKLAPATPMEDRLAKLQSLLDKKLITQSEYEQKRREILNEI